nr:hypothetical protein [Tanacetum cinerariifolium]
LVKGKEKRAGEELIQERTKKQKVEDDKEITKLKQVMEIIPDKEEIAINAIPSVVKFSRIVDWKIHKEGKKSYYQIVRADGKTQMYMVCSKMLESFDREDLEDLYKLKKNIKFRGGTTLSIEISPLFKASSFNVVVLGTTLSSSAAISSKNLLGHLLPRTHLLSQLKHNPLRRRSYRSTGDIHLIAMGVVLVLASGRLGRCSSLCNVAIWLVNAYDYSFNSNLIACSSKPMKESVDTTYIGRNAPLKACASSVSFLNLDRYEQQLLIIKGINCGILMSWILMDSIKVEIIDA